MPLPSLETLSAAREVLQLAVDLGKILTHSTGPWRRGASFRVISSLTTLEFVYEDATQWAYFVQDRTVKFRKGDSPLPPFTYETSGHDSIDQLIVENRPVEFNKEHWERDSQVEPLDHVLYAKGDTARAVLQARSKGGFVKVREDFLLPVRYWTDFLTFVVVFPQGRDPLSLELVFQESGDAANVWRPARGEKHEVRHTTQNRVAFYWEEKRPKFGRTYKILWDWKP